MITVEEIEKEFSRRPLVGTEPAQIEEVRDGARELALKIVQFVPDAKERDLAIEKIREALFWSAEAIEKAEIK